MGFKDIKRKVIKCIQEGEYEHEARNNIDVKNIFQIGQISEEEVIEVIKCCSGHQYEESQHHLDKSITVHILKPVQQEKYWYIKFYFLEPNVMFISVHESGV